MEHTRTRTHSHTRKAGERQGPGKLVEFFLNLGGNSVSKKEIFLLKLNNYLDEICKIFFNVKFISIFKSCVIQMKSYSQTPLKIELLCPPPLNMVTDFCTVHKKCICIAKR